MNAIVLDLRIRAAQSSMHSPRVTEVASMSSVAILLLTIAVTAMTMFGVVLGARQGLIG